MPERSIRSCEKPMFVKYKFVVFLVLIFMELTPVCVSDPIAELISVPDQVGDL